MTYEARQRAEALREALLGAARNGFAEIAGDELGGGLRACCDRLLGLVADVALTDWRAQLDGFDQLDEDDRAIVVARGLRLCQSLPGFADRPSARSSRRAVRPPVPAAAAGASEALMASTQSLPGIGPALAERLADRSIETVEDLLWLVPRRYDDARVVVALADAVATPPGERVTLAGEVSSCRFSRRGRMRWVDLRLGEGDEITLTIRWFRAHQSMVKRFPKHSRVVVSGVMQSRDGKAEMANPDIISVTLADGEPAGGKHSPGIISRYSDVPGIPAATLRKACAAAVARAGAEVLDGVPRAVARRLGLSALGEALLSLHSPPESLSVEEVEALNCGTSEWHRRLAFDELFMLGLAVARRRRDRRADLAVACPAQASSAARLREILPFALTGSQERAVATLAADLGRSVPMNRLLQGDVGSGKTVVAFAAAYQVVAARRQVAIMAPTEILAEQHFATLATWARRLGVEVALLTASTPRPVRASMLSLLAAGKVDMVVGTHALLAEGVGFAALGLVIIDEQHRFGVAQRVRLRGKGDGRGAPHLVVMTATPIPRTLALTAYGDLDVTVIDEMPPGREPAHTHVISGAKARQRTYARLGKRLAGGERAFVVCPLVEPSPEDDGVRRNWADATSVAAELSSSLAPVAVGLVHGRMNQSGRDQVMTSFREGAIQVLVATTVIEVGVDIPEATVMIIEDAHHFGLAQLHQLRGRVGRGGGESHCLLLTHGRRTPAGARRLEVMVETCDGFRIAEEDLQLRGPGEMLGVRQAGLPKLRFGDLRQHSELLLLARSEADRLLAADPYLSRPEHAVTGAVLDMRTSGGDMQPYGNEGG